MVPPMVPGSSGAFFGIGTTKQAEPSLSNASFKMSQGPHHQSPTLSDEVVVLTCCEQHILGLNMDLPGPCNVNGL